MAVIRSFFTGLLSGLGTYSVIRVFFSDWWLKYLVHPTSNVLDTINYPLVVFILLSYILFLLCRKKNFLSQNYIEILLFYALFLLGMTYPFFIDIMVRLGPAFSSLGGTEPKSTVFYIIYAMVYFVIPLLLPPTWILLLLVSSPLLIIKFLFNYSKSKKK